jgi:small subunit ribosomal protein S18
MAKPKRLKTVKKRVVRRNCFFCTEKKEPDYKDVETLRTFLSERAKILAATRTGTCTRHQKRLSKSIKRARFLALLPFAARIQ